jgi:hypothetical protein
LTEKRSRGRPPKYSKQLADEICERLALGDSLRRICMDDHLPERTTVWKWGNANPSFSQQLHEARLQQAEGFFDELQDIADDVRKDRDAIAKAKLRADVRKFSLARMNRAKYGEKQDLNIAGQAGAQPVQTASVRVDLSTFDESEKKQLRELARKAIAGGSEDRKLALPAISEEAHVDRKAPFVPPTRAASENLATSARARIAFGVLRAEG